MKKLIIVILTLCVLSFAYYRWRKTKQVTTTAPFTTAHAEKTTIKHEILANGMLRIKDSSRIGSLVSGTVQDLLVSENESVKKGQLLAILDNGKGDTAIRSAQGALIQAEAEYRYVQAIYEREKILFIKGLRSTQEMEVHEKNLAVAQGTHMRAQATRDAAQIEYDNTFIKSPDDGVIISIGVQKGFKVTTDLNATVLFEVARNIDIMEAEILIDESDIAAVKSGQKITFTVDSYEHKQFKTTLKDVSYAPISKGDGSLSYRGTVDIDNSHHLLRPGMTIHARIKVVKAKDVLGIDAQAFFIDESAVKAIATHLGYTLQAIPLLDKKQLARSQHDVKYLWTLKENHFAEKAIIIGARDSRSIEACDGLAEKDEYLIDIDQSNDAYAALYKKMFRGAL